MEGKVRKVDRHTRKKYERRVRRKNRRHPIEHVIELGVVAIILIVIVSVTMHSCSKDNNTDKKESTEESSTEYDVVEPSQTETYETEVETKETETETEVETTEKITESIEETEQEIPTTSSVWEDPFQPVNSWINNTERTEIEEILSSWSGARYFFNLIMGSLEIVLGQENITELTEEMNTLQQSYIMSNIILEPDNVIADGTFMEKYTAYHTLMTTMKDNLKSLISFSKRYISNDYIGYEAPLQNALGLVPANYEELADNLKHLGITLNIIPEHIKPREDWTEYIEQLHQYGIAAGICFPYEGMEYATMQELKDVYQPIFDAGLDYIVLSEKTFPFITGTEPATFSKRFIQMIRNEFGFDGVIVTANMSSDEIKAYITETEIEDPLVYAFLQGCDVMYTTESFGAVYGRLNSLYDEGKISHERLQVSVERILDVGYLYNGGE